MTKKKQTTPKAVFRIWIISAEKYYATGYRLKTSWHKKGWAIEAAKKAAETYGADNLQIHEFPIKEVIIYSLKDLI